MAVTVLFLSVPKKPWQLVGLHCRWLVCSALELLGARELPAASTITTYKHALTESALSIEW